VTSDRYSVRRIAIAKTAWSDTYDGEELQGRHRYLSQYRDGHEKFNFKVGPDGYYYGYLPPIGRRYQPPQPTDRHGWLVLFVAPLNGNGPLVPVGWYENASFETSWTPRKEYAAKRPLPRDVRGNKYTYTVRARKAHLIPPEQRSMIVVPGAPHLRSTPIVYARGQGDAAAWRAAYARIALRVVSTWDRAAGRAIVSGVGFPSTAHSRTVDAAAIRIAKQWLKSKGYSVFDYQTDCCGYDLGARRNLEPELHVEVKGTSNPLEHFYLTRNEYAAMNEPCWRLLLVTNALDRAAVRLLTRSQVRRRFDLESIMWEGRVHRGRHQPA